jgi:hypothetical protein
MHAELRDRRARLGTGARGAADALAGKQDQSVDEEEGARGQRLGEDGAPSHAGTSTECPRLDTGNSSVTPWTSAITTAWRYDIRADARGQA